MKLKELLPGHPGRNHTGGYNAGTAEIGAGNEPFSLDNDEDLDGCVTLQIVRSHQWKDHGYLREGRGQDIDIDRSYSTDIKYCPFCGAWLGGEYEKC